MEKEKVDEYRIEDGMVIEYLGSGGDIVIPDGVTDLMFSSFAVDSIKSINIPGSIKDITSHVFSDLINLHTVYMNEGIEEIGFATFYNCENLDKVYIPKSLNKINSISFGNCFSLKEIYYAGSEEEWNMIEKAEDWNQGVNNINIIFNHKISWKRDESYDKKIIFSSYI